MILSGILLTPTGVPYSNSLVRITANNTNPDVLQFVSKDFRTTVDGEYEIDVPDGWYSVSVFVNSYHSFTSIGNIEITDETTETTINALLMIGQTAGSDPLVAQVAADAASALTSKNAAALSATNAATSATNSANSAAASATSATSSQTSATNSQASAIASASSASSASTSAATATTKASEAEASAESAANIIGSLGLVDAYSRIAMPENLAQLRALSPPTLLPAGRTFTIPVAGHTTARDGGESPWYWQANSNEPDDNAMVVLPTGYVGVGRWKRSYVDFIRPEYFGAIGDFVWATQTGTINTTALQNMFNWANKTGAEIHPLAGKKYLTDSIYLYYDVVLNPNWPGRGGRTKIVGQANGHATGALEDPGCAFVHVNGSTGPLLAVKGLFSIANPTGMAGYFSLEDFNLVGGNLSSDVLLIQGSQGSIFLKNYTVKVQNPAGNGITESTTWESIHQNGLIRGGATGLGNWTGTMLDIRSDGSAGQTNMKIYNNVDCYRGGNGIRIGRRGMVEGTFGPLVFIGGQTSNSDQYGLWLDGGVIAFTSIGQQFEGGQRNAIKIDREYTPGQLATDIARNVKFINSYITGCGLVEDGSNDSYAIHVANGDGIYFEGTTFNNMGDGISVNQELVTNFKWLTPTIRTVRTYGATSGTGVNFYGAAQAIQKFELEDPVFNQNPSVQFNDAAKESFSRYAAGGFLSSSGNTVPGISQGGTYGSSSVKNLNFNNSSPLTVTNITGGRTKQLLHISFSNTNTTIASNGNIFLQDGRDFTPKTARATLTLQFDGSVWQEVSRSNSSDPRTIVLQTSAIAIPHPGTITTEHTFVSVVVPAGILGLNGILEVDAVFSYTNNANTKSFKFRYGGGAFFASSATATASAGFLKQIQNRGTTNSQVGASASSQTYGTSASAPYTSAIDTTVTTSVDITGQLAVGTDAMTLERYTVRVIV